MDTPTAAHVVPDPAEVWPFEGQDEESKAHPLIEKLVAETHTTALLTAAVTTVVNDFRQPQNTTQPSRVTRHTPYDSHCLDCF